MNAALTVRVARARFARDVRLALEQVPTDVARSALGHAVLAESLVQIAGDILKAQGNAAMLGEFVRSFLSRNSVDPAGREQRTVCQRAPLSGAELILSDNGERFPQERIQE